MAGELSINEQCAVQDYEHVSAEASTEAEALNFATVALLALINPELESREDILGRVMLSYGYTPGGRPASQEAQDEVQDRLQQAVEVVKTRAMSGARLSFSAQETAEQIRQSGLPFSAE